jgi:hypothetical protein
MKALGLAVATLVCFSAVCAQVPKQMPTVTIQGPTVIAFFQSSTGTDPNNDGGENEALSDFNYYAARVQPRLKKAGIEVRVINGSSFRVRIGGRLRTFRSGPIEVGYYLIAPGKEPHIEYGVMTDDDLIEVAAKYFGVAIPRDLPQHP